MIYKAFQLASLVRFQWTYPLLLHGFRDIEVIYAKGGPRYIFCEIMTTEKSQWKVNGNSHFFLIFVYVAYVRRTT